MFILKQNKLQLYFIGAVLLLLAGCGGPQTLRSVFKNETPYERYVAKLKDAKLD